MSRKEFESVHDTWKPLRRLANAVNAILDSEKAIRTKSGNSSLEVGLPIGNCL